MVSASFPWMLQGPARSKGPRSRPSKEVGVTSASRLSCFARCCLAHHRRTRRRARSTTRSIVAAPIPVTPSDTDSLACIPLRSLRVVVIVIVILARSSSKIIVAQDDATSARGARWRQHPHRRQDTRTTRTRGAREGARARGASTTRARSLRRREERAATRQAAEQARGHGVVVARSREQAVPDARLAVPHDRGGVL